LEMTIRACALILLAVPPALWAGSKARKPRFQTSDRCIACHNELTSSSGKDVSIGFAWRSSIMANSSRDPYWQASVRRETIDHPQAAEHIEDECSVCHMPITRYEAKLEGRSGKVFAHLPFDDDKKQGKKAADGVSCSVCHQISAEKLGTRESYNGGFVVEPSSSPNTDPEYGPFEIEDGQVRIMQTSTGGFRPTEKKDHIRKSELCATCHTLYTTAFAPDGSVAGSLPEQVPYQEWLNSDFRTKQTCQDCHMPIVHERVPITRVFGVPREGVKRHDFVAANFFMLRMLNRYRDDLEVEALPQEIAAAADYTISYLREKAARLSIENAQIDSATLRADVLVENLGGHKLPTAYPSRRCWLHVSIRDRSGRIVFESGALRPDGSIIGNDSDTDPRRFEPHYTEITSSEQVQIYEDVLGDLHGGVTTGLLTGVRYLKDNRLLPRGFDKRSSDRDIAVIGEALNDPNFVDGRDSVRYSINVGEAQPPFTVDVELWYQPIGYRWADNVKPYHQAVEPRRFIGYYDSMSQASAEVLARASMILK
jgi:hypothetical protein